MYFWQDSASHLISPAPAHTFVASYNESLSHAALYCAGSRSVQEAPVLKCLTQTNKSAVICTALKKVRVLHAILMSQARAISKPPPNAAPSIAAITGIGRLPVTESMTVSLLPVFVLSGLNTSWTRGVHSEALDRLPHSQLFLPLFFP